jgi:hypothetical protein
MDIFAGENIKKGWFTTHQRNFNNIISSPTIVYLPKLLADEDIRSCLNYLYPGLRFIFLLQ